MFLIVVFKTLAISHGSVATHFRCGGIFSDSIITNFLLENRLIFDEVKAYQKNCAIFWATRYTHNTLQVSQKKQTATVVLQLICLLTVVYASYYLRSPMVSFLKSIFRATNASPQPALFRVATIWRNATLSAVRCKSFTFYKVVRDIFQVWWVRE